MSIILGIVGWVLVGLTVLGTYLAIRAIPSDADPSGADIVGFIPFLGLPFIGSVNLAGVVIGLVGAAGKPKTQKLNWLGILLNVSPYVVFMALMIVPMFVK
ncbi:MAG: cell division protein FtsW [Actinomyces sp.]|nr:cell division protein FtsW [Actinomyces sp.]OHR21031.1 cell division protein FtsW [Actinomyces sp. HMSC035G02]